MNFFVGLEDDRQVIIYPLLVQMGKKRLVFLIFGSLLFALYGLFAIVTGHNPTLYTGPIHSDNRRDLYKIQ